MKLCVKCQIELRPLENGAWFESMADFGPYEIRMGDIWHCPECGLKVGIGIADEPIVRHHDPDYQDQRQGLVDSGDTLVQHWQDQTAREASK